MATAQRARSEAELKPRIRHELQRARLATEALLAAVPDGDLAAHVSPLQSPLVWDLAHIGWFEELWLLRARRRRARRSTDARRPLRRVRARAQRARRAADPASGAGARVRRRRPRRARSRCSTRSRSTPATGCSRTASSSASSSSTSCSTSRRCSDAPAAGAAVPGAPRPGSRSAAPGRPTCSSPAGRSCWARRTSRWAYDNERRRARGRAAGLPDRPDPGHERRLRSRSSRTGATASRRWWSDEGWAWRGARRSRAPARLEPAGPCGRWSRPPLRPRRAAAGRASRCSTSPGTRPTRYARWAGGRARRPRPSGRRRATGGLPAASSTASGGVWEWTSSHFLPYPGFEAFPYAEYSEVFFGDEYRVLRGGSWATDPPSRGRPSATGTTRSAARSSPASAARGMLDRSPLAARPAPVVDVSSPRRSATRHCAPRASRGLTSTPKRLLAEVALRRARLAALRRDHAPARVLPHPCRARDPREHGRRRSRA